MKTGFLKNLFSKEVSIEETVEKLRDSLYLCTTCRNDIDIQDCTPLSLLHCPHCNDLFMTPMLIEPWWVLKPLGSGGMGAVYEARHMQHTNKKAAVKVLQDGGNVPQVIVDSLMQEAYTASHFGKHKNLAQVYGYGNDRTGAYFIMEMIAGVQIDRFMEECGGQVPLELALYIVLDIIDGLEHIYQSGFLYRDLKPENVLIKSDAQAVIVDYGLCMSIEEAWNYTEDEILGSPLYMPPERIKGEGEDFRSDFYALGMLLYMMIKGQPYFEDKELLKVIRRQCTELRLQTNFKLKGFGKNIATLTDGLIKTDRNERFQSYDNIREFIHPLLKHMAQKPTDNKLVLKRRENTFF